jgi:hypothetical protein
LPSSLSRARLLFSILSRLGSRALPATGGPRSLAVVATAEPIESTAADLARRARAPGNRTIAPAIQTESGSNLDAALTHAADEVVRLTTIDAETADSGRPSETRRAS